MKTGNNKWLIVLLATLLACCLMTSTLSACGKKGSSDSESNSPTVVEGEEKGVYSSGDITLTLSGTGVFTLSKDGNLSSGTYEVTDNSITLAIVNTEEGEATCSLQNNVLVLTIGTSEYRLYKQIRLSVTFNDGSGTSAVSVNNGSLVTKPADPVKEGYRFIAWYKAADFSGKPFDFETEIITEDITLYAKWIEYAEGTTEYTVSFNLGYDTEDSVASRRTVNGTLLDAVSSPVREGYSFMGWWISAYDQADKLTCQYTEDSSFTSDTTLFALWQADGTTLGTMNVTSTGASWAGVAEAAKLTIAKPDGTTTEQTFGASAASAYAYDLTSQPAGEYKFTLTYGNNTVERYYLNKALARVSGLKVVNSTLLFEGVDNAEGYYITVRCGDNKHNHTDVSIGKNTTYDFANCPMVSGGIVFTVKAVATNYYQSVATFTYDKSLAAVKNVAYDATTGLLTWSAVENAQHYVVTVAGQEYYLGTETKLDIKSLPAGEIAVTVQAVTEGFNSAAATSATINKTDYAAPSQLAVKKGVLTWSAVEGAKSYRVQINDSSVDVSETTLTLDAKYIASGKEYAIKVKAVFDGGESLWSDAFALSSANVDSGLKNLTYANGKFGWEAMSDADAYEYKVNDGVSATTEDNFADVTLTKAGDNQLQVRYRTLEGDYSGWATYTVKAYSITLDSQGGAGVASQYKAVGDSVKLPETERTGYEFAGWYNVAGGSASNGSEFVAKTLENPANIVLYANWLPRKYQITLDYNKNGEGTTTTVEVTYTQNYALPVPEMLTDEESAQKAFDGWYATADGKGVQYTDELGNSLKPWNITDNITLYAKYVDAFAFTPDGEGGYSVKAGKNLGYYTATLTIPSTYKGLPVRSISEYGFQDYSYLTSVTLPDTLEVIPTTAFDGCKRIEAYHIAKTDKSAGVFTEENNSIIRTQYGETTLQLIPCAITGEYKVPVGVSVIGSRTFNNAQFDAVVIPASVTKIDAEAFVNCASLKNVIFDETVLRDESGIALAKQLLTIASNAFSGTAYVEKFVLPARLAEIDNVQQFFSQFKLLSYIEFTGSFAGQVYSAFTPNDGGKNIAGMLTNANKDEIIYCPINLNNATEYDVEVPSSVIKIAAHAFDSFEESKTPALKKLHAVTKITVNGNLAAIGDYAFYNAKNLTEVSFKAVTKPVGLTIGDYAFYKCNKLSVVTFEEKGSWNEEKFTADKSCGVTSVGEYAFSSTALTDLKLPNSLKTIGDHAFEDIDTLKSVELANVSSELEFGDYAFAECRSLSNVELTENVPFMDFNLVFYKCPNVKFDVSKNPNYTTNDGVIFNADSTQIVFYPDFETDSYTVPDTVKKIGGAVFSGKSNLRTIVISANVEEIADSAFEACENLASVTIAGGNVPLTIGNKAFYNCTSLKEIELPGRVVSIGDECFAYFGSDKSKKVLTKVTLNEGLQTIGNKAFFSTINLESINIPSTVTSVGTQAFWYSGLSDVTFAARDNGTELVFGESVFNYCTKLTNVVLPEGLVSIPKSAFQGDTSLKSVTIPTTVRNYGGERAVGEYAFAGCTNLSEVIFTKGGTYENAPLSFAGGAFQDCDALTKLSLPNRISSVNGNYDVFEYGGYTTTYGTGTFNMHNGTVPAWNKSVSTSSINDVCNVAEIEVEEGGEEFCSYKGVLYNADKSVLVWCPFGKVGEVEVAKETETFRESAFNNCHHITSVVFEKGGTADFYMKDAKSGVFDSTTEFYGCFNLTSITFPARLTRLGEYALYNNTGTKTTVEGVTIYLTGTALTKVSFEEGCKLTEIGKFAFGNANISELELPSGVTTIGENAFKGSKIRTLTLPSAISSESFANVMASASTIDIKLPENCTTLAIENDGKVVYSVDKTYLLYVATDFETDKFVIPATVTNIAANAFNGRTKVKAVEFESSAADLKIGNNAFSGMTITSIELPARIKELGTYLFANCASLTSVTFEQGYKYATIPDYMFQNCKALESITIPGEVTSIGRAAFKGAATSATAGLKTVTFDLTADGSPSLLETIEAEAFESCSALATINYALKKEDGVVTYAEGNVLPYSLTDVGRSNTYYSGPFKNCTSLTQIKLPDNLTYISKYMFSGCKNLADVTLPSALNQIKQYGFENTAITELDFSGYEDGSLTIFEFAFNGCSKLTKIDLSKVGTLYLSNTFKSCTSLTSIEINDTINLKGTESSPTSTYNFKGFTSSGLKTVTINQNVPANMFNGTSITTVTLGANVKKIGDSAFASCTKLTTVNTDAVSELVLDKYAFKGASALTKFDMSKVTEIGQYAFQNCTKLADIGSFNDSITEIPNYAFDASGLTAVDFANSNIVKIGTYAFRSTKITSLVLPSKIESIGNNAFEKCTSLKSVDYQTSYSLPSSIFSGCTALADVTLNDEIDAIGASAFNGCTALTSIDIKNVATLGANAFTGCTKLAEVGLSNSAIAFSYDGTTFSKVFGVTFVVPENSGLSADGGILYRGASLVIDLDKRETVEVKEGTASIEPNAFRNNTYVKEIKLPASVATIEGYYTFNGCTNLASINLENVYSYTPTTLDKSCENTFKGTAITELKIAATARKVFAEITNLAKVTFVSDSEIEIAEYSFYGSKKLATVAVEGKGVITKIGDYAFDNCAALTDFDFKEVTELGIRSFEGTGLTSVTLSKDITKLPDYAFNKCASLESVAFLGNVESIGSYAFADCKQLTSITVPSSVKKIGNYAFSGCSALASIELPAGVEDVGTYLFQNCTSLTSVTLNEGLTSLSNYMFKGCTKLVEIKLPSTVTEIGNYAFSGCSALASIKLPAGVEDVGTYLFQNCTSLTSVTLNEGLTSLSNYMFTGCTKLVEITLPSTVTEIGNYAFEKCTSLTTVNGLDHVKVFGNSVFSGCTALESITINDVTEEIGTSLFNGCTSLTSVTLGNGITKIPNSMFNGCTKLVEITLPSTVTEIGQQAFSGCTSLETVSGMDNVTTIGNGVFYNCKALDNVEISDKTTLIGGYIFYGCTSLKTVKLSGSITFVPSYMFSGCTSLETVTLSQCVTLIYQNAFEGCSSLKTVNGFENVVRIGSNAFKGCTSLNLTISDNVIYVGSSAFSGWTATQNIAITGYTETTAPAEWESSWNTSCKATITWKVVKTEESAEDTAQAA